MRTVIEQIYAAANGMGDILLLGETGTGKTTIAEMIHRISPRANRTFKNSHAGLLRPS